MKKNEDAKEYYIQTVDIVTAHFNLLEIIMSSVATVMLAFAGGSWLKNNKISKEHIEKLESLIDEQKKEKEELKKELKKELYEIKYCTLVGFAINRNTNEEKVIELEKIIKEYIEGKKISEIYFGIAYYCNDSNRKYYIIMKY